MWAKNIGLGIKGSSIFKCVTAIGSREPTWQAPLKPNGHDEINIGEKICIPIESTGRDRSSDVDFTLFLYQYPRILLVSQGTMDKAPNALSTLSKILHS